MGNGSESATVAEEELVMEGALARKNPSSSMVVLSPADPPQDDHELEQLDGEGNHHDSCYDGHEIEAARAN